MQKCDCYESYPVWIVIAANLVSISIYGSGMAIFSYLGFLFPFLFLLYCVWVESKILKHSCVFCYYYGKRCAWGRGILCSWLFNPKAADELPKKEITFFALLPDILVGILPIGLGAYLLLMEFRWSILFLMVFLAILFLGGNAFVHGTLACVHCKRKETGCPALELFEKKGE